MTRALRNDPASRRARVPVVLRTRRIRGASLKQMFRAAAREDGQADSFLLESRDGPERDCHYGLAGLQVILRIEITRTDIRLTGAPRLVEAGRRTIAAKGLTEVEPDRFAIRHSDEVWCAIRAVKAMFDISGPGSGRPFGFGFFGYFAYDAIRFVEELTEEMPSDAAERLIELSVFATILRADNGSDHIEVTTVHSEEFETRSWNLEATDGSATDASPDESAPPAPSRVADTMTKDEFETIVQKALEHIRCGDIYQIQIGHQVDIDSAIDPWAVYQRLSAYNPSPYMFFARCGESVMIGASPELYVRVQDDKVVMRPIAGTAPRSGVAAEDHRIGLALQANEKEIAEHVMLVDLCRNDIARICRAGTLDVDELLVLESYYRLYHLVSNVKARKKAEVDALDVIAATFPAGTMTGAPKVRAMELIERYETSRRYIYSGAIGVLDIASNDMNLGLCIRMGSVRDGTYSIRASAGIVADSVPASEWRETIVKMSAMYFAITGMERSE